ncbi:MAG: ASCH domain-containing protein [Planctomycetes bacterium]|nr:ASCH domain-containing protein [Planctomycetota bacterium]
MPFRRRHAAIVDGRHAELLRAGIKTIETRIYRHKRLPYGRIRVGDLIYFKLTGGEVFGSTKVVRIRQFENLTPAHVRRIRQRYNHAVCAEPAYWAAKRSARYAVLIWLQELRRTRTAPRIPRQYGNGWLILRSTRPPVGERSTTLSQRPSRPESPTARR